MVDDKAIAKVYRVINSYPMRSILKTIGLNGAMTYSEIMVSNKKLVSEYNKSSKTAYYVRCIKNANMLKLDITSKKYILSRIGVQTLDLITNFEKICMSYDLSDVDADGKIEFKYKIKGRKL